MRLLLATLLALLLKSTLPAQSEIPVIPYPKVLKTTKGQFPLQKASLQFSEHETIKKIQQLLLKKIPSLSSTNKPGKHSIQLILVPGIQTVEGYNLHIRPKSIVLEAGTPHGLFNGVQTLLQLCESYGVQELPCMEINDQPQLKVRSAMLDVSRHFYSVAFIKNYLELLAYFKINTFHWHLTDDQGWRIEIKKYPELTHTGAWRTAPDGTRYGGFYTQDEIKEIVNYAADLFIQIIPEIEIPGHIRAALAAYPELSCTGKPGPVPSAFGVHVDVLCLGNPASDEFVKGVLEEVLQLFPGPYVHIGGDECPTDRWQSCTKCQARYAKLQLNSYAAYQGHFTEWVRLWLKARGKTMIGWDEVLEGHAHPEAVIEVWRGKEKAAHAIANGNSFLQTLYLDSPNNGLTLEKSYQFDPYLPHAPELLLGADAPLWSEWADERNAYYRIFPRILAFSEKCWSGNGIAYNHFYNRWLKIKSWMDRNQLLYSSDNKNLLEASIQYHGPSRHWKIYIDKGRPEFEVRAAQGNTISMLKDTVNTCTIADTLQLSVWHQGKQIQNDWQVNMHPHLGLGKPVQFKNPWHPNYGKAGAYGLTDGIFGNWQFSDGTWLAWWGPALEAVMDLGAITNVSYSGITCLQQTQSWIILPRMVEFWGSADGQQWESLGIQRHEIPDNEFETVKHRFEVKLAQAREFRYLKILATPYGQLPEWHAGKGYASWIFADEWEVH